jgi:hypothetical protein
LTKSFASVIIYRREKRKRSKRFKINEEAPMEKEKIDRINELGRIAKQRPLTEEETAERAALREEYLRYFRAGLRGENNDGGNK